MSYSTNGDDLGVIAAKVVMTAAKHSKDYLLVFNLAGELQGAGPVGSEPQFENDEAMFRIRGGKVDLDTAVAAIMAAVERYEKCCKYPQPRLWD